MKKQTISILVLAGVLLFSGLIVIAGGSMGWQSESPLPIHRSEFCREAMMEELGVPKKEIDKLKAEFVMANWPILR
jgi:hypothetical protein